MMREIPSSREAENYVLGSVLIENRYAAELVSRLDHTDFYYKENANIMSAIIELDKARKEIDVSSIIDHLREKKLLEATGGTEYLFELMDAIPSVVNVEAYIEIIKEKSIQRELLNKIQDISNKILENKLSFHDLIAYSEREIVEVLNKRKTVDLTRIDTVTDKVLNIVEANKNKPGEGLTGLDTGFTELNKITFGFQPGELIILAARPGIGKSAMALNLATNNCEATNSYVAFFSLEMGMDQILMRLFSTFSGLTLNKIRSGKLTDNEMALLYAAKHKLDKFNLYFADAGATDVEEVVAVSRRLKREGRLDFVIVDYLQLLTTTKRFTNRVDEVSKISRQLKLLARELQVPVVALSQLSRDIEKREDKRPVLSDLRESGSIEQDADIVMFLHREQPKDGEDTTRQTKSAKTEVIVAKNRQGMTGSFHLFFDGSHSMFIESSKKE